MYPTMFEIPFLPDWLADVKSYGVMMTIAFLTGIWMACKRAVKSHGDPDIVLNMGFIALVCGIVGARIMYVAHYWDTRFANQASPILAAFDIRAGGLEFLGGPILTVPALMIYLRYVAKVSMRWYLDFSIPALPWGLALTRIGCFLNGCCWGAVCIDEHSVQRDQASIPWAVRFPYGSPAMIQQFRFGQIAIPKELIVITPLGESYPLRREQIEDAQEAENEIGVEQFRAYQTAHRKLEEQLAQGAQPAEIAGLRKESAAALSEYVKVNPLAGQVFVQCDRFGLTPAELRVLADQYRSKPVHPAQLYAVINGLLLSGLLSLIFYYRRRHGVLLGVFLLIYPVSRFLLELIRQDNPLDYGGLTISQFLGLCVSLLGAVYMWYIYRLPEKCPRAVEFIPPDEVDERRPRGKNK